MLYKGQLKRWNEDKGFGFINSKTGMPDVFIHISALKEMSRRPVVGDIIYYEIHTDNEGKNRAVNARIEGISLAKSKIRRKTAKNKSNWFVWFLICFLIIPIGLVLYKIINKEANSPSYTSPSRNSTHSTSKEKEYNENYSCDGRVWCSEMTSCDEATYFIQNCPGTKMDGNGDGTPCESQWCN
ncbi:MAG: cold shock domain-containing protein [Gammaproteobacteria bacterium]|nr:MAG: cold shock domain-containing protein [Gammaproteobacteria bacterium]RKZ38687.1 MAG: cold shock domain-containing protein [Gammaproteobacteria bacterium]RKZ73644.1 MAG: cold shock domain-containing protein [Gammaproteobacteria bacterium]